MNVQKGDFAMLDQKKKENKKQEFLLLNIMTL
jgi:hypothetical protein